MKPLVIGHRGFAALAPENTMGAFCMAWEAGADGVECDVHLTADGEVICIHDSDTARVSDSKLVVAESNWKELRDLDVGGWKSRDWAGERIPELSMLLASAPAGKQVVVEIKCGPEIVGPLVEVVESSLMDPEQLVFISFDADSLTALKQTRPALKAYWLSHFKERSPDEFEPSVSEIVGKIEELGVDGFGGESGPGINAALIDALKAKGLELNVWTVDEPKEAVRMRDLGVTSITANNPRLILDTLSDLPMG